MGLFGKKNNGKNKISVEDYGRREAIKRHDTEAQLFYEAQLDRDYQKSIASFYDMSQKIEEQYAVVNSLGDFTGTNAANLEIMCKRHIGMAEALSKKWRKYKQAPLYVVSYKRLAMLYEKQGKYLDSSEICMLAIRDGFPSDGTAASFRGRMARMVKKGGFEVTEEILEELNKPV